MDKRELRKIPLPAVTKKLGELGDILRKDNLKEYICKASVEKTGNGEILMLDVFDVGVETKETKPVLRAFMGEDDYITLDLQTGKTSWKTGSLQNILGYIYWYPRGAVFNMASTKDIRIANKWLGNYIKSHEIKNIETDMTRRLIDAYQEDIMHRRLVEKWKKQRAKIDERMAVFRAFPDGFREWVDSKAMYNHNYMFFDKKNRTAYCTRCRNEFGIEGSTLRMKRCGWVKSTAYLKHNKNVCCPYCISKDLGVKTEAKSGGYSRKYLQEVEWVVLVDPVEVDGKEAVGVRYVCCVKDYSKDIYNPGISFYERERTIQFSDKVENYEMDYDHRIESVDWIVAKQRPWSWNPSKYKAPVNGEIPYDVSAEHLKGSWLQYSCMDRIGQIMKNQFGRTLPYFYDRYINFYRENPYIEKFIKLGWDKLVKQLLESTGSYGGQRNIERIIDKSGRTAADVLKISRNQFLMLSEMKNPELHDIRILHYGNEKNINISFDELTSLRYMDRDDDYEDAKWKKLIDYKVYTTLHKLTKYGDSLPKGSRYRDYFDYLEWTKALGYDMRNTFNLFPKDFVKSHDARSKEFVKARSRTLKKMSVEFNRLLKKYRQDTADVEALNMNVDGLFIRLPEDIGELKKEGEALHHCVGTYKEKVLKGETTIFFIRKISAPSKSYYTLEWKDGKVVQCRGMKNCDMTPEVKKFVNLFKDKMAEYEKKFMKVRKAV